MTEIRINGSETDVVRVFHLDLPREAVARFTAQAGTGEWPLKYAFGAKSLRPSFVDVIDLQDLDPLTLSQYLSQAYTVPVQELKDQQSRLDALKGHVIVMPSRAFGQQSQTLAIASPLVWIGTFGEVKPDAPGPALRSESASGLGAAPAASSGKGGSTMLRVLVAAMALIVIGAMVLILR